MFLLLILDGFGYSTEKEGNAIAQAHTPHYDAWLKNYPHTLLSASGLDVGLPEGQMGNSEVGHLNMGAGRRVPQDLVRINESIESGEFFKNAALTQAIDKAIQNNSTLHVIGLLSDGGVHSHEKHSYALLDLAASKGLKKIAVHAFLDGRDTLPKSAEKSLAALETQLKKMGVGRIASLCGRYDAMDRDKRWDRTEKAYQLLTEAKAPYHANTAVEGLQAAYARGETDEFVSATVIGDPCSMQNNDVLIAMNFRADRMRQIISALTDKHFSGFTREKIIHFSNVTTLTEYDEKFFVKVAFPPMALHNTLGEYIAAQGKTQLRIAETEKYAHVTFFFNGGAETPFAHEDRMLISSPKVATYDLQPEMSAGELTEKLVEAILSKKYDLIICNYANADMVGHSGKMAPTIKAIEALDTCFGDIDAALKKVDGEMILTADHGNAECMIDEDSGGVCTSHSMNPVPCIYVGKKAEVISVTHPTLSDIAPTILSLMKLPVPSEMTGRALFRETV